MCLLSLKHLVSLQARTRPSFQTELDLRTAADELMEKEERNVVFVPLNVLLRRDALQSFFFFCGRDSLSWGRSNGESSGLWDCRQQAVPFFTFTHHSPRSKGGQVGFVKTQRASKTAIRGFVMSRLYQWCFIHWNKYFKYLFHTYLKYLRTSKQVLDWSVCLLALKHLVSLQAHTRPSFQAELDLRTAADELMEKEERNVVFVPLNVLLRRDALQSFFFFCPTSPRRHVHIYS